MSRVRKPQHGEKQGTTAFHLPNGNFPSRQPSQRLRRPLNVCRPPSTRHESDFRKPNFSLSSEDSDGFVKVLRRKASGSSPCSRQNSHRFRQSGERFGGNRGFSHPQWGCGPREPHRSPDLINQVSPVSLFVDGIPENLPPSRLRSIFENIGCVVDVFISK